MSGLSAGYAEDVEGLDHSEDGSEEAYHWGYVSDDVAPFDFSQEDQSLFLESLCCDVLDVFYIGSDVFALFQCSDQRSADDVGIFR